MEGGRGGITGTGGGGVGTGMAGAVAVSVGSGVVVGSGVGSGSSPPKQPSDNASTTIITLLRPKSRILKVGLLPALFCVPPHYLPKAESKFSALKI